MKIAVIGSGHVGLNIVNRLEALGHTCVLHDVVGSKFTDLKEPEPLLITKLPEFKEPWINPKEPVFNYRKHEQTCIKNRKARKKKKRR